MNTDCAVLHTNLIDDKNNENSYYNWEFNLSKQYNYENAKYNGELFVLMNSKTSSSGENAVAYAKSIKKCITIGENTCGCGVFGELKKYMLPNSKMFLWVPCKIFKGDFQEGEGYTPDY